MGRQIVRLRELENWLTAGDVAKREGISRQAVHKRLDNGRYRAIKTRAGWLIDPESVPEVIRDTGRRTPQEK
jgi:hypothetical protein